MNKDKTLTLIIRILLFISVITGGLLLIYIVSLRFSANEFDELEQTFNSYILDEQVLSENVIESKEGADLEKLGAKELEESEEKELEESEDKKSEETDENKKVKIALQKIQEQNKDTVGWISIPGTKINYPVMYTPEDPEYYINRSFEKKYSINGVPFISHKSSMNPRSDNVLIHGHNMKDGSMFSQLLQYKDKAFLKEYPVIEFYTSEGKEIYDILAVIPAEVYSEKGAEFKYHNFTIAKDKEDFDKYIQTTKKLSLYDTGITAEYGEYLLTLSTCAYHTNNGRFVVIGKMNND